MFENVSRVDFGEDVRSLSFNALISREGEKLPLNIPINIKLKTIEAWLNQMVKAMKESIFKSINKGIESYLKLSREKWYVSNIS